MLNKVLMLVKGTGWRIFPCMLEQQGRKAVKKPCIAMGSGYQYASSDRQQIMDWWSKYSPTMYGIPTGRMNNIVALDVDHHAEGQNGFETLMELAARGLSIPETLTVSTPSGGLHYYFKNPADCDIRNSAGKIGAGLDVRGNGGFIVGFMSSSSAGEYRIVNGNHIAQMPDWLVELCQKQEHRTSSVASKGSFSSFGANEKEVDCPDKYAKKVFYSCCEEVEQAQSGTRNNTLFKNAAVLYSYSAGGCFSDEIVRDQMTNACRINGLAADKGMNSIIATLESARRHGYAQPVTLKRRIANA